MLLFMQMIWILFSKLSELIFKFFNNLGLIFERFYSRFKCLNLANLWVLDISKVIDIILQLCNLILQLFLNFATLILLLFLLLLQTFIFTTSIFLLLLWFLFESFYLLILAQVFLTKLFYFLILLVKIFKEYENEIVRLNFLRILQSWNFGKPRVSLLI